MLTIASRRKSSAIIIAVIIGVIVANWTKCLSQMNESAARKPFSIQNFRQYFKWSHQVLFNNYHNHNSDITSHLLIIQYNFGFIPIFRQYFKWSHQVLFYNNNNNNNNWVKFHINNWFNNFGFINKRQKWKSVAFFDTITSHWVSYFESMVSDDSCCVIGFVYGSQ